MSVVLQLIREAMQKVPIGASFGVRWRGTAQVAVAGKSHQVGVAARIDHKRRRREQFTLDGVRVDRCVLLRLTCAETECPQAKAVRAQWDAFRRRAARPRPPPLQARPLIEEFALLVGGHQCSARPARFTCFTHCPNRAHPALLIEKTGYDLFEDGVYVGGGLVKSGDGARPRLPTLEAAEAFVLARRLETMAALDRVRSQGSGTDSNGP